MFYKKGGQKKGKKKKTPRQKAIEGLDSIFSKFIRLRDKGVCISCRSKKPWKEQQNGHYVTRGNYSTRWDEENCNCQCVGCNIFKKGNYPKYAVSLIKKYGEGIIQKLDSKGNKIVKISTKELEEMVVIYKAKVDEMLKVKS